MVKIDRSQVLNSAKWSSGGNNRKTVIVLHETANKSRGAGAYAHHRLQYNGNPRQASWHYQVDDSVAVQTYSEDLRLWHAGSVAIPFTISIEICVNSDSNYNQAILNAIDLCVDIAKRNNITTNNIVTHYFYTGKNCPTQLLSGRHGWTFNQFINRVEQKLQGKSNVKANPPKQPKNTSKTIKQLADEVERGLHGNGAERMKSLGTQYEKVQQEINRRYGVSKPKPKPKPKRTKSINTMATEVIRGIHGQGHSQRQRSLGVNNATYQKVRNEVNRRYS